MRKALLREVRYLLMLPFFFTAIASALAQGITVSGRVVDERGDGMPGVTVLYKGTTTATGTDLDGNYSLAVPSGTGTLVYSFVGYQSQEVAINNRSTVNVTMSTDAKALDEVVVVGYQTVTRRELTSSVSSVGAKQLADIPVSTAGEALAGRLAGVQVTTAEGQPGAEISIRVRGGTSITQSSAPLYIVDGIQVDNALSFLSPQEIQSIDVLKDAASTSIYGARGANGVVIITTKGGKEMPTQVTYNGFTGVRTITNTLDVMKPYDFVRYQYDAYNIGTNQETRNSFRDRYGRWEDLDIYRNMPFTDWQDEVFGRNASGQTHILGLTGGSKTTSYNFNLNHADEEGIMLNSGFRRTLASFKFDHKVSDRLKTGFSTRYSHQKIDGVGTSSTGTQSNNRLRNAVRYRPFIAPGFEEQVDEFDPEFAALTNMISPILLANQEIREDYRNDLILNGWFSYDIIKNLTFKTVFGINSTARSRNDFSGPATGIARQNNNQPVVLQTGSDVMAITNSNTLNYKRKFGSDHSVNILLGEETWQRSLSSRTTQTRWLPVDITPAQAFASIQQASPPTGLIQTAPSTYEDKETLFSLFGNVNYNFREKYRATVTLRRDASSLFAPENRVSVFPSAALAWHIAEEDFMANTRTWLSDMKVRLSMGEVGNNRLDVDLWKTEFLPNANDGYAYANAVTPGFAPRALSNRNLKWETTLSRNLGFDFSFFNSRLNLTTDFYYNTTDELLLLANIPPHSGYTQQLQNIGELVNKGIEVQLDAVVMDTKDFTWNANFNIGMNRNKILSLGVDASGNPLNSYLIESGWISSTYQDFIVAVGQPLGQFYGYVTDGFYTVDDFVLNDDGQFATRTNGSYILKDGVPSSRDVALGRDPRPGDLKLQKLSDDDPNNITAADRTILGTAQPKFIGGFNQQFAYKGFDMSLFMNFSVGSKVYNANKIEFTSQYLYRDNNMLELMNNRWKWFDENGTMVTDPETLREMNRDTEYWTPPTGQYFLHSFAIEDGSFLRISNLTLGYSIPESILKRTRVFSKFRVYATVNNLATITGYSGYDPEANTRRRGPLTPNVDYAAYPRSRYILGGVNVTF